MQSTSLLAIKRTKKLAQQCRTPQYSKHIIVSHFTHLYFDTPQSNYSILRPSKQKLKASINSFLSLKHPRCKSSSSDKEYWHLKAFKLMRTSFHGQHYFFVTNFVLSSDLVTKTLALSVFFNVLPCQLNQYLLHL